MQRGKRRFRQTATELEHNKDSSGHELSSPVAQVAGTVLVCRAARASADAIHILITLGGVLSKVDPCPEHPPDVGVALVEAFVDDSVDEGGT